MANSYEKNIRWKAISIYLLIAVICIAVSLYIYSLSGNVRSQKQHIENYSDLLKITNRVVFSVSEAQTTANLYLNSKNASHLNSFRRKVADTEELLDSLAYFSRLTGDTANLGHLMEIGSLLRQKGDIIYRLNTQLSAYNPVDSLARILMTEEPVVVQDSVLITTIVSDTVYAPGERGRFWDRVSTVFNPDRQPDAPVSTQNIQIDTLRTVVPDSGRLVPQAMDYMEQIRTGYSSNLRALERQINSLLVTDQEISAQIIEVLNRFHRATIRSTLMHIEDSEEAIQRNYRYSFAGIMISLLLITFFIILIINDTNKGQRARMDLERANRRIREIMASRHKLLLSVSHDVKTPLNAILGYLELWKQGRDPEQAEISAAELSGKHIDALFGNLLEFSSLEQGTAKPSPHPFGLLSFCEETAGMIRPLAIRKGLVFETYFQIPSELYVDADSMRLRQIVLNILSNAVKYTAEGTVNFKASYKNNRINISIRDTGSGMNQDEVTEIFKPFHRLESNLSMAEGHGFGMFVVKGLVDLLGGDINVVSEPLKGTTVSVFIPAPVSEICIPEGSLRLLFIDDDTVLLKILSGMASSLGHHADTVSDPDKVISGALDISRFDMIVTDMEMGRLKGTDVLAAVKATGREIPVIVMTGHHDLTALSASELGFDGYLSKPVSMASLEAVAGTGTPPVKPGGTQDNILNSSSDHALPDSLTALFGEGEELQEIMETFKTAAADDIRNLRAAVFRRDWRRSREICHRMLPLFRQFGSEECTAILARINKTPAGYIPKNDFWKDVNLFIEYGSRFLDGI